MTKEPINNGLTSLNSQSCANNDTLFVRKSNDGTWQDWINVTELQSKLEQVTKERDELKAHVNKLHSALKLAKVNLGYSQDSFANSYKSIAEKALNSVPEQSLAEHDKHVSIKAVTDFLEHVSKQSIPSEPTTSGGIMVHASADDLAKDIVNKYLEKLKGGE